MTKNIFDNSTLFLFNSLFLLPELWSIWSERLPPSQLRFWSPNTRSKNNNIIFYSYSYNMFFYFLFLYKLHCIHLGIVRIYLHIIYVRSIARTHAHALRLAHSTLLLFRMHKMWCMIYVYTFLLLYYAVAFFRALWQRVRGRVKCAKTYDSPYL